MSAETDLIKLYSDRILALAADIPNTERLEAPTATVKRRSPLCGSTVTVDLRVEDGKVVAWAGCESLRAGSGGGRGRGCERDRAHPARTCAGP
jgi:hypothetical protein